MKIDNFSDVVLVSNYHGSKVEAINLIPHYYLLNCKTIIFRKIKIIQNVNNLIFQVIFIIFDSIFINQIIVFSTSFCLGGTDFHKYSARSFEWGTGAWVKMHRSHAFSTNVNTMNLKIFLTHGGIYKSEKMQQAFWREMKP